ncbi:MAG: hypothetical protein AAF547_21920, partial [Actinomycetota bacterium]
MTISPTGLSLRPARPDRTDGLAFARWADQAADGLFDLMLGSRAPEIIATVFAESGHELSHQHVTIAEIDDRPVAMISAFMKDELSGTDGSPLEAAAGWRRWRLAAVGFYASRLLQFLERV